MRRAPTWRAQRLSPKSKEAANQASALWEMISTHNKSMLVIIHYRLSREATDERAHL